MQHWISIASSWIRPLSWLRDRLLGMVCSVRIARRLPAGAMLYTVAICLLVAMVLTAMVLLHGYSKIASNHIYFQELAQDNLVSGKNLILYGRDPAFGKYAGTLFESPIDSYVVEMRPWGMYGILSSEGVHGPARARETILFGQRPQETFAANLFLDDRNHPLQLAGHTHLQGTLYVPAAGLRPGIVGRTSFEGASLYQGTKHLSKSSSSTPDYKIGRASWWERV
jgi:hypothetical protein